MKRRAISRATKAVVAELFDRLDYKILGDVYCYEGGDEFWHAKRKPCQRLGLAIGDALLQRLLPGGRSLYVGAGVAELPPLLTEVYESQREVTPYNLRRAEVVSLNRACRSLPLKYLARDAASAKGRFDHLWMVSVLNDPERFPHLSPLSYGNVDPVSFNPVQFQRERRIVQALVNRCMPKLRLPGLVTTTTEEVRWIAEWCHRHHVPYLVERKQYATALVGDPICFIRVGMNRQEHNGGGKR
jgi:hypothetical protein